MSQKRDVLTKEFAEHRKKQIKEVNYDLHLWFEKKSKSYKGSCTINVKLNKISDLVIDSISKVQNIIVNNKILPKYKKDEFIITIPKKALKKDNKIEISYAADYGHTGSGLHHFVDPADKSEYIYTQFEPYDAHRMFPCFDQPDLKSTYNLIVTAPKDWIINSNSWEKSHSVNKNFKTTKFRTTYKFSTYLFHVSAGPFHTFKDKHKNMPLRIFCRKSIKNYVPYKDMFLFTKQGLDFYPEYFGFPYPFDKYDQIFCPEFNHGAMENVGAITFSEHLLARRKLTHTERASLANVVLHEMAHMWFGDLVTMKWWNDIWLNESFADFMSYLAMYKATDLSDAWESFYSRKQWAYVQDQLSTTHPIAADARDTDQAFSNFDGISYSKGAATLKQLLFYIGEPAFRRGLKHYFNKFKWQNTELKDFRECLEKGSGKNLKSWFKSWIHTTGVNTISPELSLDRNNKIKSLTIKQLPSKNNNVIRPHKTQIALIYNNTAKVIPLTISRKVTSIPKFKGWPAPTIIHSNYGDHDYSKSTIDRRSIRHALENIDRIIDPLTRHMIYGDLWHMVRDVKLNPRLYLKLIMHKAPEEENLLLLETLISRALVTLVKYIPDRDYNDFSEKLFQIALKTLQDKNTKDHVKTAWFDLLISTYAGANPNKILIDILNKKIKFKGLEIDQDKRWRILARLSATNFKGIDSLLKKEIKKDNTDNGEKFYALCIASQLKNKPKIYENIINVKGHSLDYLRTQMGGFYWKNQKKDLTGYTRKFFKNIIPIFKTKDRTYANAFSMLMFPSLYTSKELLASTKKFLKSNPKAPSLLKKSLKESIDDMQRTLRIRAKYN